jgi:hypothetical protein
LLARCRLDTKSLVTVFEENLAEAAEMRRHASGIASGQFIGHIESGSGHNTCSSVDL